MSVLVYCCFRCLFQFLHPSPRDSTFSAKLSVSWICGTTIAIVPNCNWSIFSVQSLSKSAPRVVAFLSKAQNESCVDSAYMSEMTLMRSWPWASTQALSLPRFQHTVWASHTCVHFVSALWNVLPSLFCLVLVGVLPRNRTNKTHTHTHTQADSFILRNCVTGLWELASLWFVKLAGWKLRQGFLVSRRRSKLGACLSVCDIPKRPPGGLADVHVPFTLHITGSALIVAGWCKRDSSSSSLSLIIRGPRQRRHVSYTWLNYITSACPCRKKRSRRSHRTRSHSQKEIRKELQSIPKTIHIPSGLRPSN